MDTSELVRFIDAFSSGCVSRDCTGSERRRHAGVCISSGVDAKRELKVLLLGRPGNCSWVRLKTR